MPAGQRVLVVGASGAGKSTLLRAMAGLLLTAGHGELSGHVSVAGHPPGAVAGQVGLLLQDPPSGVVAETVGRDVAFGLENACVPPAQMWPRVREALAAVSFPYPPEHATSALSGGETQRLVLAGSLVLPGGVLLLDEPTSMLDPAAAEEVRGAIRRVVEARGSTLVVVEHHLEPWLDFMDRVVVLGRDGAIVADGPPQDVLQSASGSLGAEGVWVPGLPPPVPSPLRPELVGPWHEGPHHLVGATDVGVDLRPSLGDRRKPPTVALDHVDADLTAGQILAVTGPSGAGKSTLVSVLAGLARPDRGDVVGAPALATRRGPRPWRWTSRDLVRRLAWVPQVPEQGMVTTTVLDEVMASARASGRDGHRALMRAEGLLEALGLSQLRTASPYHLSGGEQRRLMVAAALVNGPLGLLLDEPTVGQDRLTWAAVVGAGAAARDAGVGVAIASHDQAAVDALADRRLRLESGLVTP